ncbi:NUDIX domain-containing protein [Aeoliella mucimassa]|nr:NUDIX domain-containing protein [Aeoliella mucimassa]
MKKRKRKLRVRAVIVREGHLLLCRHDDRDIAFLPGGRVERGERLDLALRREIMEETGAPIEQLDYLGAVEHRWYEASRPVHDLNHFFAAECPALTPTYTPECEDEGVHLVWVEVAQVPQQAIYPQTAKRCLVDWLSGERATWWGVEDDWPVEASDGDKVG